MAVPKIAVADWVYHNALDRHRPMFLVMQGLLFFISALFWVDARTIGVGFDEATWGSFAYAIPAELWAFVLMATSSLTMIGLVKPVKRWMVAVGCVLHCVQFLVLSYSAVFTGGVFVVGLYASCFFLPLHAWMLVEALDRSQ